MPRSASNAEVAQALREMALFLDLDGVAFKPQAYQRAAATVAALDRPLATLYADGGADAIDALPGIGKGIARRIVGLIETGRLADLERLRKKTPVDILGLTSVEGIGPRKVRALWDTLHIKDVAGLKRAAQAHRVRDLPRFGPRSEARILEAIGLHEESVGRRPLGEVLPVARALEAALAGVAGVVAAQVAGSLRRHRDTIGDIDLVVAAAAPGRVTRALATLPEVAAVLATGPTKTQVRMHGGLTADLRVVEPAAFGAALLYFTGSKAHNVALRGLARSRGLKLNEYGLYRGARRVAGRTEAEVYAALGLSWVPPELREATGEVEAARRGELPTLVTADDLRGDLQVHTSWSDGADSIEAIARAARDLGHEYVVITDHTRDLAVAQGLDEERLRAQIARIRQIDRALPGIRVLAGAEVNIRVDGSLDVDDAVLAELDVVGAAIHAHFELPRVQQTQRILRAVEHPAVDLLFHPTCRAIGRRRPLDVDWDRVFAACKRHGTALEIDGQPDRLDLPDTLVRAALAAGVRIAIDSDAHAIAELGFAAEFGVGVARRGWAEPAQVLNTLPVDQLLGALGGRRPARGRHRETRQST